jgi:hypothetical protein
VMIQTEVLDIQIQHKLTKNFPRNDLFIEIDDLQGNPVCAFTNSREAARWLQANGFRYIVGSSGIWTRRRPREVRLGWMDGFNAVATAAVIVSMSYFIYATLM